MVQRTETPDALEKAAVEKIKSGEGFVESVEYKNAKPIFRAMTAVPVVMEKCVMCHPHYESAPEGAAIGAIGYSVPIQ